MKPTPQERAAAIGAKAKTQPPVEERRLGAIIDRELKREHYRVVKPHGFVQSVIFNPKVTIAEAQALYPGCEVTPA